MGYSPTQQKSANRAINRLFSYKNILFSTTSPNILFYKSPYGWNDSNQCHFMSSYERLTNFYSSDQFDPNNIPSFHTDIVYGLWGEPVSNFENNSSHDKNNDNFKILGLIMVIVSSLMISSSRKPITLNEAMCYQCNPIYKYKYWSGKM